MNILATFRRFKLNLGVIIANAEGAIQNFKVFYRGTIYNIIIFKFQWHSPPGPAPSPADAHYLAYLFCKN